MPAGTGLEERLATLLVDRLHTDVPMADIDLFESGILDSLRFVEFLAVVEQEFGMRVELEELEIDHFRTLSRIAAFLTRTSGAGPARQPRVPAEPAP